MRQRSKKDLKQIPMKRDPRHLGRGLGGAHDPGEGTSQDVKVTTARLEAALKMPQLSGLKRAKLQAYYNKIKGKTEVTETGIYKRLYYLLTEAGMPEKEAKKKGLQYKHPEKTKRPGFQSDASVKGKPVVVRHGWKSSKRKPRKHQPERGESHRTVRIKSAGEEDHLARRSDVARSSDSTVGDNLTAAQKKQIETQRQANLKTSMQSRKTRRNRKNLASAAKGLMNLSIRRRNQ